MEAMDGWIHLPRYIDKIRLHLAGRLHPDYADSFGRNSDGRWLAAAGVSHETMLEVVAGTVIDGEVCDWVHAHIRRTPEEKAAYTARLLNRPDPADPEQVAHFERRKAEYGLEDRPGIARFIQLIDANEGRL
ncbi:MAG: hypothetical protein JWO82_369 [Akkermansiaceae bacterium]|nr:hypothetical protein [Akkermansiaceae bacterium]